MIKVGKKYKIVFPIDLIAENDTLHNQVGTVTEKLDEHSYYVTVKDDPEQYIIYEDEMQPIGNESKYLAYDAINDPED